MLDYSTRLLALYDEARGAIRGGQPAGDFVLGSMYSTAAVQLPKLLASYHRVNLQVQSAPSGELLEGLITGRLDAAFVDGPITITPLDGVALCEERLVLICEADHPPVCGPQDVAGRSVFTFRRMRLSHSLGILVLPRTCGHGPGD